MYVQFLKKEENLALVLLCCKSQSNLKIKIKISTDKKKPKGIYTKRWQTVLTENIKLSLLHSSIVSKLDVKAGLFFSVLF